MQPTFENAAKLTLLGCLTKRAFDISPEAIHGLTGAAIGGAVGGLFPSKSTGNRAINAMIGAGLGGAAGYHGGSFDQGDMRMHNGGGLGLSSGENQAMESDPAFAARVEAARKEQLFQSILRHNQPR